VTVDRRSSTIPRVPPRASRYRADAPPDYSHRFHAGNVGDVWKHCVLLEVLARARPATVVETHAGAGRHPLAPTGEWTEGVGRLWRAAPPDGPVRRWLDAVRALVGPGERPAWYPGSPLLSRAVLPAGAALVLCERDAETARVLAAAATGARVVVDDGLAAVGPLLREARGDVVLLVDPPWTEKSDWTRVPEACLAAARAAAQATILLWYPVKSLTRPNAMLARFARAGVAGAMAELVTTPLGHQRQRLNGSGMVVLRPPAGALEAIGSAAPVVGAACATRDGVWSARIEAWDGVAPAR